MLFGVDYYPEHWPRERWAVDINMMKEAGINVVRLAEFAWHRLEPRESVFEFTWLDEIIQLLEEARIDVILGTPTAAPPKWLIDKHPDILPVDVYGNRKGFGTRRHYCANNHHFKEHTEHIVNAMSEQYKNKSQVIAWQIDNEFSAGCYCDACLEGFKHWLEAKYTDIEQLNEAWGTVFWSQSYNTFDEIMLPMYSSSDGFAQNSEQNGLTSTPNNQNPSLLLDYKRFQSDSIVNYQKLQIDIIREKTQVPITHNYMGHFDQIDYFELGKDLDVISWDCYPDMMWGKSDYHYVSMAHDLMRGIKNQNFWMMEQQSGPCGWQAMGNTPEPGQIRLWTYQSIAHGAEAIIYFRWRPALFGTEQYWHGILDHDGKGRRRYKEVTKIGQELKMLSELILKSSNPSEIALIKSYDNLWSHSVQPHSPKFNYNQSLYAYYKALKHMQCSVDVTSVTVDFDRYRLIVMPNFNVCDESVIAKCEAYVKKGGNLLLTYRSGSRHMNNQLTDRTLPGYFKELSGIEIEEYDVIASDRTTEIILDDTRCYASKWCDVIDSQNAEIIGTYTNRYYAGKPAITCNKVGAGNVFYVGCDLDEQGMDVLIKHMLNHCKLDYSLPIKTKSHEVEIIRKSSEGEFFIVLNHSNNPQEIDADHGWIDMLTDLQIEGKAIIPGYGVWVLKKLKSKTKVTL